MDTFKTLIIGNKEYTAMKFGPDGYDIPTRLMQVTRENGILVTDDDIFEFPWRGITKDIEGQYILFDKCQLESFDTIATTHRSLALSLLRKLSLGLKTAKKDFLDLSNGILPLYQVLIHEGKNIVILPKDCAEIIATSRLRDIVDKEVTWLMKPDTEKGYSLLLEMGELMYLAASGVLPYGAEAIRHAGFKEVPLELYEDTLDQKTASFISSLIDMNEKNQRKISGNRKPEGNMDYFLENTEDLSWNLEDRTEEERAKAVKEKSEHKDFTALYEAAVKKAKRKDFWRKMGVTIIVVAFAVSLVGYLVGNFFYQKYKPPVTRDMSREEIILHLFDCQNALDTADLSAGFKGDPTQFKEVLSIYINSATRNAYEGIKAFTRADEWVASGMGDIPEASSIYGVTVESIEQTGENDFIAHTTWYTPYPYDESEMVETVPEGKKHVYVYHVDEEFTFQWNKRGWWQGIRTAITSYDFQGVLEVGTFKTNPNLTTMGLNYSSAP